MAAQTGDWGSVAEIDERLNQLNLAEDFADSDTRIGPDANELFKAELRGAAIEGRQRRIELGSDGRLPRSDLDNLETEGRLP